MLTVEALRIRYGEVEAVRRVDLAVASGEIIALVGANGAGKSSTLGAIAGLVPAAGGRVALDGVDITGKAPEAIARLGVALVPEGRRIFASLSVAENMRLGGAVHLSASEAKAVVGGLGSLPGAVAGGFLLGMVEVLLQATLPASVAPYRDAIVLSGVIAVLLVRPQGLIPAVRVQRS